MNPPSRPSVPPDTPRASGEASAASPEGQFVTFPGSPFQLFQPYPPAGDQPTAIAGLVEGIEDGEQICVTALTAVIEGMEVKVVSRDGKEVTAAPESP